MQRFFKSSLWAFLFGALIGGWLMGPASHAGIFGGEKDKKKPGIVIDSTELADRLFEALYDGVGAKDDGSVELVDVISCSRVKKNAMQCRLLGAWKETGKDKYVLEGVLANKLFGALAASTVVEGSGAYATKKVGWYDGATANELSCSGGEFGRGPVCNFFNAY